MCLTGTLLYLTGPSLYRELACDTRETLSDRLLSYLCEKGLKVQINLSLKLNHKSENITYISFSLRHVLKHVPWKIFQIWKLLVSITPTEQQKSGVFFLSEWRHLNLARRSKAIYYRPNGFALCTPMHKVAINKTVSVVFLSKIHQIIHLR